MGELIRTDIKKKDILMVLDKIKELVENSEKIFKCEVEICNEVVEEYNEHLSWFRSNKLSGVRNISLLLKVG